MTDSKLVRIQDHHPFPAIRARPRRPKNWRNPATNLVERFDPIFPLGEDGPVFYDIPPKFAEETFAQDTGDVKRYHLISPAEFKFHRTTREMASKYETRKALKTPVGADPKVWAEYLKSLEPVVEAPADLGKDPDISDAERKLDESQGAGAKGGAKGAEKAK